MRKIIKNCSAKEIYDNFELNKNNQNYLCVYQVVCMSKSKVEEETSDETILWYALDKSLNSVMNLFGASICETFILIKDNSLE